MLSTELVSCQRYIGRHGDGLAAALEPWLDVPQLARVLTTVERVCPGVVPAVKLHRELDTFLDTCRGIALGSGTHWIIGQPQIKLCWSRPRLVLDGGLPVFRLEETQLILKLDRGQWVLHLWPGR